MTDGGNIFSASHQNDQLIDILLFYFAHFIVLSVKVTCAHEMPSLPEVSSELNL
ncbi:hypothetical protein YPPY47_4308 [Yersinia pestis PY-47]|nr:hypothetical protein YPPY03_4281 [Yersinia pestis PY-03]EIQ97566.1 hypothetical protein YPPY04_4207 [Yersinia pestis PY-04]EIR02005.1 hypothetical protein YPPY06_4249 [Yersinia pestis PY-06]EIR12971.1 hypothetical protein YPPY07_4113 [Yersinia pestis PY-07]EIR14958.1 hypothetical protein YPPY09_4257 [Yersinia pestis PY-09]EIR27345.1 hypothetical protein YPPY10_4254 [Yersinia pestis PY-10]EIR27867.1 hypothetical protein YPPY11_4345 [Yersinia pestis PY-11]EIR42904.1 hypothetical protein YPP